MKKRIVSLFMAFVLCLTLLPPTAAAADTAQDTTGIHDIFVAKDSSKLEKFKERVLNRLLYLDPEIDVSDIGILPDEIVYTSSAGITVGREYAARSIVTGNPFHSTASTVSTPTFTYQSNGCVATVKYTYHPAWTLNFIKSAIASYDEAMGLIKPGDGDFSKILKLHDWIVKNVSYGMSKLYYDCAIGALVNRSAVCAGYAYCYQFLLEQAGIENIYISAQTTKEPHAWNLVKLDGHWFHVDCTWDAPALIGSSPSYRYFLLNDAEFNADGVHTEDWKDPSKKYPQGNVCSIENKFYQTLTPGIGDDVIAANPIKLTHQYDPSAAYSTSETEHVRTCAAGVEIREAHSGDPCTVCRYHAAKPVLTALEISGPDAVRIPSEMSYTVKGRDQNGQDISLDAALTWSVEGTPAGVSIADGKLTVTAAAAAGSVTVKAESGGVSGVKTVTLSPRPAATKDLFTFTAPALTYNGSDQIAAVKGAAALKDGLGGKVGTVTVSVERHGAAVTQATEAGSYTVFVSCAAGTEYGAMDKTQLGAVVIGKAEPDLGTVSVKAGAIYPSTALDRIELEKTGATPGTFAWAAGQTLTAGTRDYNWIFTPADQANYNSVNGKTGLTVLEDALTGIEYTGTPVKTAYRYGESFDPAGIAVTAHYQSGATKSLQPGEYTFDSRLSVGQTAVTLTYQGKTCTVSGITVGKAVWGGSIADRPIFHRYDLRGTYSVSFPAGSLPADRGRTQYTLGAYSDAAQILKSGSVKVDADSGQLSYALAGQDRFTAGQSVTVPVSAEMSNYETLTVSFVITLTDKEDAQVTLSGIPSGPVAYGDRFTLTATAANAGANGRWIWSSSGASVLAVSGSGSSVTVSALKSGTAEIAVEYVSDTAQGTAGTGSISVNRRTLTAKFDNKTISKGSAFPAVTVSYGNFAPGDSKQTVIASDIGSYSLTNRSGRAVSRDTARNTAGVYTIAANGSFPVLRNEMLDKYAAVTDIQPGTLTVTAPAASGGGTTVPAARYTVRADVGAGGSASMSHSQAETGKTVTVTVKPESGYHLDRISAATVSDSSVSLTKEREDRYRFTMPGEAVIVTVRFKATQPETPEVSFADVSAASYYYDAVKWAVSKEITGGTGNNQFSPNNPCTRAQIVTFLWRAAGSPSPQTGVNPFSDVSESAYYYKAVLWATENGITGGTGNGQFSPNAVCTRGQGVTFLHRASGTPASGTAGFSDVSATSYYYAAVAWASEKGITGGTGNNQFSPNVPCTRAQIVTFLFRSAQ